MTRLMVNRSAREDTDGHQVDFECVVRLKWVDQTILQPPLFEFLLFGRGSATDSGDYPEP